LAFENVNKDMRFFLFICFFLLLHNLEGQAPAIYRTPKQTLSAFQNQINADQVDFQKISRFFPQDIPETNRVKIAKKFVHILDGKGLIINPDFAPQDAGYTDTLVGRNEYRIFPDEYPEIYLAKYDDTWLFSYETVLKIPQIYQEVFPFWAEAILERLPDFATRKFIGIAMWHVIGLCFIFLILSIIHFAFWRLVEYIMEKSIWDRLNIGQEHLEKLYSLAKNISLIIMAAVFRWSLPPLMLPARFSHFLYLLVDILQTLFILLAVIKILAILKEYLLVVTSRTSTKIDNQLVPVVTKSLTLISGFIAFIHILALLGVNVTALIAGVSVGALAIALAAQDTFKNLFGSLMIFLDKPFQVGDYILSGDIEGTVEEVGVRSTRVRRVDSALISVPNGNLANATLNNLGIRRYRQVTLTVGILYSTPPAKIQEYIDSLRQIPAELEFVHEDTALVFLRNLSASSIDIFFRANLTAADFATELKHRERVIFEIIHRASDCGVSFAFPSTSVYIEPTEVTDLLKKQLHKM
jgi:MscS family membrane protein